MINEARMKKAIPWASCQGPGSKARERSAVEGIPRRPPVAQGCPRFVPPCFEAMQGLFTY